MKPTIDQYILDHLPIMKTTDISFCGSITQRSSYIHWYFTAEDDTTETATAYLQNERANKITNILN